MLDVQLQQKTVSAIRRSMDDLYVSGAGAAAGDNVGEAIVKLVVAVAMDARHAQKAFRREKLVCGPCVAPPLVK